MLTLRGSRRDFLRAGALGVGGLTLPHLLRLRADTGSSPKSVIMVCLSGGPSHIDMYDLKPDAPAEVRGPFRPIRSNVPGFDLCELFPLQAGIADKLALARTVQWAEPMQHELQEVYSGFPKAARRPAFGAAVSREREPVADRRVPGYVSLDQYTANVYEVENPQYLGAAHRPFLFGSDGVKTLARHKDTSPDRLADRGGLLTQLDTFRRQADAADGTDAYTRRALDIVTSAKAREAFDLAKEDPRVRDRYGRPGGKYIYGNEPKPTVPWPADKFLLARRLAEAGVAVVTLRVGTWDYHGTSSGTGNIFTGLRSQLPLLDRSVHALVTDLHDRGLDKDVLVLVWGEFGRTPKVNNVEGRDHWPDAGFALFAGGGLRTGQVIGETDARAAQPKTRPLTPQNVLATVYRHFGIDPAKAFPDFTGRPVALLDDPRGIDELG